MGSPNYIVVGAGVAGATCAERLASAGFRVLVIEQRPHIAGNAYDRINEHGILVHEYGAHIFHTNSREVFDYLSRFTEWRRYQHCVRSVVGDRLVPFPINRDTLQAFGGDLAAATAALITPYTRKQWGPYADQLDPSVLARVKPRWSYDDRYFQDTYQAMPVEGYTALVGRMLTHPNITIRTNTRWQDVRDDVSPSTSVIFTGPLDEYFDFALGRLPYRSARFVFETRHSIGRVLPAPVVNYPAADVPHTRVAEFRQITGQPHHLSTLAYEYPTADGDPYWPVLTAASHALAERYRALAVQSPRVHFCGRLGTYRYVNLDQAVAQALHVSQRVIATARTKETV